MRVYALFSPVLLCGLLHAQTAGWNRVEALAPGTRLIITTERKFHCTLSDADERGVYCDSFVGSHLIPRSRIAKIAVANPQKAVVFGTVIGAAAGGIAVGAKEFPGAANARTQRVLFSMVAGGFAGNVVGRIIGRSSGHTIYVQP